MLGIDQRLRLAVSALLTQVGADRVAPEMPDDGGGAEADGVARILETPAHVDVVTGCAVGRVEPAQGQERVAPEGHIAAGDVLGGLIGQQHMGRAARRYRDC